MNLRRLLAARLALLGCLALAAPAPSFAFFGATSVTASGKVVTESRPVHGYSGVKFSLPGTLVIRQGPTESLSIDADDNLMPEIESVVEGGTLRLRFKRNINVTGRSTIRLLVTGPAFQSVAVAGSGDVVSDAIKGPSLDVSIAGSGDMKVARLEAGRLAVAVAGSGDFRAAGRANEVSVKVAGSGDVDIGRIESGRATVSIAGSGDVTVWAAESVTASILGSGDVRYYGNPAVTKSVAGSGTVKGLGPSP